MFVYPSVYKCVEMFVCTSLVSTKVLEYVFKGVKTFVCSLVSTKVLKCVFRGVGMFVCSQVCTNYF